VAKVLALVEVKSADVATKRGMGRNNKPYEIREQTCWIDLGGAYPERMVVRLEGDSPPYQPGKYVVTDDALYLDKYNQLALGRITLRAQATAAATGARTVG
jgi:hypothetical protein